MCSDNLSCSTEEYTRRPIKSTEVRRFQKIRRTEGNVGELAEQLCNFRLQMNIQKN